MYAAKIVTSRVITLPKEERSWKKSDWWTYVDKNLEKARQNYLQLFEATEGVEGTRKPIFLDIIIKLLICRAYANNVNKKPLSAHRLLERAESLINDLLGCQSDLRLGDKKMTSRDRSQKSKSSNEIFDD